MKQLKVVERASLLEARLKERRRWAINPRTRVVADRKGGKYTRARAKAQARRELAKLT